MCSVQVGKGSAYLASELSGNFLRLLALVLSGRHPDRRRLLYKNPDPLLGSFLDRVLSLSTLQSYSRWSDKSHCPPCNSRALLKSQRSQLRHASALLFSARIRSSRGSVRRAR